MFVKIVLTGGPACETCDAFVPTVIDSFRIKEVTLVQMDICGIPVGNPYVVKERFIDGND